jgi:uncharacterized membrane protein YeaQ/YmgE (transglycosylase-associated protein family)
MHEDRVELLIAAVIGALLGIITGYLLGHGWALTVIWALIGAVVVNGMVYCYRGFSVTNALPSSLPTALVS